MGNILKRLAAIIKVGFVSLIYLKAVVSILLTAIQDDIGSRLAVETNLERRVELQDQASRVYLLMVKLGVNYRALGKVSMFIYAGDSLVPLLFYLSNKILFKRLINLEGNLFYQFMKDPKQSETYLKKEIDYLQKNALISHLNYLATLNLRKKIADKQDLSTKPGFSFIRIYKNHSSQEDFNQVLQSRRLEEFLRKLSCQGSLKPAHRTESWHQRLNQFGCLVHMININNTGVSGLIFIAGVQNLAYKALRADQSIPEELRKFSLADRLTCVMQLIFIVSISELCSYPVTMVVVNIRDLLKHLGLLKSKFRNYLNCLSEKTLKGRELDEETLKLYLEWVLFIRSLKTNLNWFSFTLNQYVVTAIIVIIFSLELVRGFTQSSLNRGVVASFFALAIVAVDLFLILIATFHSKCIRLSQRAWSVVARSQEVDQNRMANSHSLLLWRRLQQDSNMLVDWFSCKLFYSLTVNYQNIIRLNFWLISFTILLLSFWKS